MENDEATRLGRRLERERRARLDAERIAEASTRDLYDRQLAASLLQDIAAASNEAETAEEALQFTIDRVCAHTGWPVGHVYLASESDPNTLIPSTLWHLADADGFSPFRAITEQTPLPRGIGLPGRVLESGQPLWITDVTTDTNFPRARHAIEIGVRAGFAFPIMTGHEVVGVLEFFARESIEPIPRVLDLMSYVGTQLGRVIERDRAEAKVRHMAYHDALTGLPNRWLLKDRFELALAQSRRSGEGLAVASLDLDRFKLVNDSLGHTAGDYLLREASARLAGLIEADASLARFGGDEFVLLLPRAGKPEDAARIADAIVRAFRAPFVVEDREVHATISVGVSLHPSDGDDAADLFRNADTALYRAKEHGRNTYQLYQAEMTREATARLKLEAELRRALQREEFVVHYQPVIDAVSNRIVGAEALVRWQHPVRGLVPPVEFIGVAEETGLIIELGDWVLEHACRQAQAWQADGFGPLRIAVNISMAQFAGGDFLGTVRRVLLETNLEADTLELEITESIAMRDAERAIAVINDLRALGVRTSVDDFGTGFSSLKYLKDLPVHTLKIDRSFVRDLAHKAGDATIARSIITLAHSLNLRVIAEGVETEEQARFLRQRQCDELQGYLWSVPLPAAEFMDMMQAGLPAAGRGEAAA